MSENSFKEFNLKLVPKQVLEMAEMKNLCELTSNQELFNNAMTVFHHVVHAAADGKSLVTRDDQTGELQPFTIDALKKAFGKNLPQKPNIHLV